MYRIAILLIVGGGFLGYFGIQEFRVSMGTSGKAVNIDLAKIEKGEKITDNYVAIGEHVALFAQYAVISYQMQRNEVGPPAQSATVNYCYYPIISRKHPFIVELDELIKKHRGHENVPKEKLPKISNVRILIKTHRFNTVGSVPTSIDNMNSIKGVVINDIATLDAEEAKFVKQGLPDIDLANIYILEEGREPSSFIKWGSMIGGGALLILAGIGMFFFGKRRR